VWARQLIVVRDLDNAEPVDNHGGDLVATGAAIIQCTLCQFQHDLERQHLKRCHRVFFRPRAVRHDGQNDGGGYYGSQHDAFAFCLAPEFPGSPQSAEADPLSLAD